MAKTKAKQLDELKNAIKSDLKSVAPLPQFNEVVDALKAVSAGIAASVPVKGATVTVEPGYRVNFGQQYNIVLQIPSRKFRDVLFRAYVPPQGYPVRLDFFGEDLVTCSSLDELSAAVRTFVREQVGTRLATLA
jgi:hypothetical protein